MAKKPFPKMKMMNKNIIKIQVKKMKEKIYKENCARKL